MINAEVVRRTFQSKFQKVEDAAPGIIRAESQYANKAYAVAYIDVADDVIERADNLSSFQENLLGSEFFSVDTDLRWNSYLFFLAGPKSVADERYQKAKAKIEADRHYARKFVVTERELIERFTLTSEAPVQKVSGDQDAEVIWAQLLREASLGVLLEQRARTQTLDSIASGEAFVAEPQSAPSTGPVINDALASGLIRELRIGNFRRIHSKSNFDFGDVNLIFGPNGAGKTSLLEAIEILYCGRVRRDIDAVFDGIEAKVETLAGELIEVAASTVASVLKARNRAWYGRSDVLSSAISHGFTRFNFLDTDAAFRLSSETDSDQINDDLSQLLVGPGTSKLWNYLSKLEQEVRERLKVVNARLPELRQQQELVASEVARFRSAPTDANALAKTFHSSIRALGMRWKTEDESPGIDVGDRKRLEDIARGISQVLTLWEIPAITIDAAKQKIDIFMLHLPSIRDQLVQVDELSAAIFESNSKKSRNRENIALLQRWIAYCESGVPTLERSLRDLEASTATLRSSLTGLPLELLPEVSAEYANQPLADAIQSIKLRIDSAIQTERSATQSLLETQQFEQSLSSLRKELQDVAIAVLKKAGDESLCPVCSTPHGPNELLLKIQNLVATSGLGQSDSLRNAARVARETAEQCRLTLDFLTKLEIYRSSSKKIELTSVLALRDALNSDVSALIDANRERDRVELMLQQFDDQAGNRHQYTVMRQSVLSMLSDDVDDLSNLRAKLESLSFEAGIEDDNATSLIESLESSRVRAHEMLAYHGIRCSDNAGFAEMAVSTERFVAQTEAVSRFLNDSEVMSISRDGRFSDIQVAVDEAIVLFDRALQAERVEQDARKELDRLLALLNTLASSVSVLCKEQDNLVKASLVLSDIVENHSLERATKQTLNVIRDRVGEVFRRIHSPSEYAVGDFVGDAFLVALDNSGTRRVNQISSGQRAALALSIFLGLHGSAKTAPPVLLIDDPVAHVDDLNTLSFLDYLRDLAVQPESRCSLPLLMRAWLLYLRRNSISGRALQEDSVV
ncbi:hypothetical protein AZ78_2442 [Lysobacter capsici AZ78]|uniref:Rad50/SbcC-type AAA domain-containing protein n=1 Tax=Lysobacter capsici AZ78 TaxID=1444315 RepID=A0A108U979_9GAMM|nr:AAA family ATPase [Lysobacter capsici]KWS04892.1 hypothetical protein AZ78_2442 [Lysobacter capsici AZ78]